MAKATESEFDELHGLLTREMAARVRKGEDCPTADLRLAVDWLVKHNWTGTVTKGTPLADLLEGLTEGDQEFIERLTA